MPCKVPFSGLGSHSPTLRGEAFKQALVRASRFDAVRPVGAKPPDITVPMKLLQNMPKIFEPKRCTPKLPTQYDELHSQTHESPQSLHFGDAWLGSQQGEAHQTLATYAGRGIRWRLWKGAGPLTSPFVSGVEDGDYGCVQDGFSIHCCFNRDVKKVTLVRYVRCLALWVPAFEDAALHHFLYLFQIHEQAQPAATIVKCRSHVPSCRVASCC